MSKNNNNAGMHFVRCSRNGKYDDLGYYDKHSPQGIANRRNEAIAILETMGEYSFSKKVSYVYIQRGNSNYNSPQQYKVFIYDKKHEETLKTASTSQILYNPKKMDELQIRIRVHDSYNIIYIVTELYEEKKHLIKDDVVYKLK